ncbi:TPA: ATP-binding protein [Serratia marcescens]
MTFTFDPLPIFAESDIREHEGFSYHIGRIALLFQRDYLLRVGEPPEPMQPLFLPVEHIDRYLSEPHPPYFDVEDIGIYLPDQDDELSHRLQFISSAFDLTPFEQGVLLAALLPRLSDDYSQLPYGGLQDGVSRVVLVRLFSGSQIKYRLLQAALHPASPLFQFALLSETQAGKGSAMAQSYVLHESVWQFLCGNGALSSQRYAFYRRVECDNVAWSPPELASALSCAAFSFLEIPAPVVVIEGRERDGREQALASISAVEGRTVSCFDVSDMHELSVEKQKQITTDIVRDTLLDNAVLILESFSEPETGKSSVIRTLEKLLPQVSLPLFLLPTTPAEVPAFRALPYIYLAMPSLSLEEKVRGVQAVWPVLIDDEEEHVVRALAQRYHFCPADVSRLVNEADYYRAIKDLPALSLANLHSALSYRSRMNFGKLAQRITPRRTFEDLVVSAELKGQLEEILSTIRLKETIINTHFQRKAGAETGVSVLFYGESGTGKTLAAEVIAQHLGVDLIKVDLPNVVDKFIGETEKNLSRIFDLAQVDSGVLFFDEADALFGKRSETKDARDRHANIEVSYLLQRLETYPGLVILATNNRSHLDSAFNRRFTFITRFTYPDLALREAMWRTIWPSTLNVAEDVDIASLAARSELTGANIRNVALLATVLAVAAGAEKIQLHHIEQAINRELAKLGRLPL